MRRFLMLMAAGLAAVLVFALATLPPAPAAAGGDIDPALQARTIPGAFHIHTVRSDGRGDKADVAGAAARAGLRFAIFTDHGDATREPDPAVYINGVLCIDAVEISTNGGHYIALDMPAAPYPLGGEPAAVAEDVRRLGGFGVAAHPDSAKPALSWRDWTPRIDGIEWLNADSEWRNESMARLGRTALDYLFRPGPALASMLDRPSVVFERVDHLPSLPPVVLLAGHDAHGGVSRRQEDQTSVAISGIPSYEASFRSFALRVIVNEPLSGTAQADSQMILDAIKSGHVFTAIDAVAHPALLDFHARTASGEVQMGDVGTYDPDAQITARALVPKGAHLVLLRDGEEVAQTTRGELTAAARAGGKYRVEVRVDGAPGRPPVPWLVSNPLYLVTDADRARASEQSTSEPAVISVLRVAKDAWHSETDPTSHLVIRPMAHAVALEYRLGEGERKSQFVAAVAALPAVPDFDRVALTGQASPPARVSIQFRFDDGERWLKSVYLPSEARRTVAMLDDFRRAGPSPVPRPDFRRARDLIVVVDLTNSRPGSSGVATISDIELAIGK